MSGQADEPRAGHRAGRFAPTGGRALLRETALSGFANSVSIAGCLVCMPARSL